MSHTISLIIFVTVSLCITASHEFDFIIDLYVHLYLYCFLVCFMFALIFTINLLPFEKDSLFHFIFLPFFELLIVMVKFWIHLHLSSCPWLNCCYLSQVVRYKLEVVEYISTVPHALLWSWWPLNCFVTIEQRDCTMLQVCCTFSSSLILFNSNPCRYEPWNCFGVRHSDEKGIRIVRVVLDSDVPKLC